MKKRLKENAERVKVENNRIGKKLELCKNSKANFQVDYQTQAALFIGRQEHCKKPQLKPDEYAKNLVSRFKAF